jgi:hypothetical protein
MSEPFSGQFGRTGISAAPFPLSTTPNTTQSEDRRNSHPPASAKSLSPQNAKISERSNRKRRTSNGLFSWTAELLSLSFSLLALIVTIVIVQSQDEKPLLDWPVTVNALVSVFSSIFKAAMLMLFAETISELKWLWFSKAQTSKTCTISIWLAGDREGHLRFIFRLPRNKLNDFLC